jgi:predicted metal-dependent phosphoesterase TrpH
MRIRFDHPDPLAIRESGYTPADLHVHSSYSDSPTPVRALLARAESLGIGLAITDHNEVRGVAEALAQRRPQALVIPGMEVSTADGPHILLYFPTLSGLQDFYAREIREKKGKSPYLAVRLTTEELVERGAEYDCLITAAHPFGYFFFDKGLLKCTTKHAIDPAVAGQVDAFEVICGGMRRGLNRRAADEATRTGKGMTGGTDSHLLGHLGGVVTCCQADTAEEFIEEIRRNRSMVVGEETGALGKVLTGGAILRGFLPYTLPSLQTHYEQNLPRLKRYFTRRRT